MARDVKKVDAMKIYNKNRSRQDSEPKRGPSPKAPAPPKDQNPGGAPADKQRGKEGKEGAPRIPAIYWNWPPIP